MNTECPLTKYQNPRYHSLRPPNPNRRWLYNLPLHPKYNALFKTMVLANIEHKAYRIRGTVRDIRAAIVVDLHFTTVVSENAVRAWFNGIRSCDKKEKCFSETAGHISWLVCTVI
jgi:hypothetical protein